MSIKITRTLFVGLGGTGVQSILRAKQCFIDAYGEVPPMVAFLAVDTDTAIRNASLPSRKGLRVTLSDNEICFCGITGNAISIFNNNPTKFQWIPKRNKSSLANLQNTGAGQVRSNGRFLARHNAKQISNVVAAKVTEISSPLPINSRFVFDTNKDGAEYPIIVNVVGSVAGGTGSGTILDMLVLIAETLQIRGLNYYITPWMVLPDVFRHMAPGPLSANVYQNAYGAIRELDYLYHLQIDNTNALDFDFAKVNYLADGIGDSYLLNNTNGAGVVFQNIQDLTDSIGRCMFLTSNEISQSMKSVMDNLKLTRPEYTIRNKQAHYMSAGSAEIVYDNQAVGNVIAKGIIANICSELVTSSKFNAINEVSAWTTSPNVAIQEKDVNLLTDSLLSLYAPFGIIIAKDSDINTIDAYITAGYGADNIQNETRKNKQAKLENVKTELDKKYKEILNTQNGIGAALDFLDALSIDIDLCKSEMFKESSELKNGLAYQPDWSTKLSNLRSGIFNIFDRDAADALQTEISEYIAQQRDLIRHNWAIQFYTDLKTYVDGLKNSISTFKSNIRNVESRQLAEIQEIRHLADTTSKFQIYLHSDDVNNVTLPNVEEVSNLFRKANKIDTLVDMSANTLIDIFYNFAKVQPSVVKAVNTSVEDKIRTMDGENLKSIFVKIKEMSSPLWTTYTQGYQDKAQGLITLFTIGVYDQSKGIIQQKFLNDFTTGAQKPIFATTHETDRITFFQTQCFSPAFAVNNMLGYKNEAMARLNSVNEYPVFYLDEKWHQRMLVDGFDIWPKQVKDTILPNWVSAIVYGFIKFDEERNTYFIESEQGDILAGGFLELGQRRDLAFDQFQTRGLDKEVEGRLQQMILDKGRPTIMSDIKRVKADLRNYVSLYAQLSPIEKDRVIAKDPAYQMVRDLLEKEVDCLKNLDIQ